MMGMGLIGALGGLGEGIASIADQNIKADNEIRIKKELAIVDEQREARRLALAQKYKIEDEQRGIANRQKLLDTEGTPENIANQAGKLKLKGAQDEDAARYDESKLSIKEKAALEKERATARMTDAHASYYEGAAKKVGLVGGERGGLAQAKFDAKQLKDARDTYQKEFNVESITGSKTFDGEGHRRYVSMFNALVNRGVDPTTAADKAFAKVSEARNAVAGDTSKFNSAYAELDKQLTALGQKKAVSASNGAPASANEPASAGNVGGQAATDVKETKGAISTKIRDVEKQIAELEPGGLLPTPDKSRKQIETLKQELKRLKDLREKAAPGI